MMFILFLVEKAWNHGRTAFLKYETDTMHSSCPPAGISKWSSVPKVLRHIYQADMDVA